MKEDKKMQKDIRLLTLYKQHYMDRYEIPLTSEYSAWGYYDGFDIRDISEKENVQDIMESPVSRLWYGTADKIMKLGGGYSNQNIALFRGTWDKQKSSYAEKFWENKENFPFFAIGFLQLSDRMDFENIAEKIEQEINITGNRAEKSVCMALTYATFDNADLVLLLQSNSVKQIMDSLDLVERPGDSVEQIPSVRYLHSILSVSEQYLQDCKRNKEVLGFWHGTKCFVEDRVLNLTIQFVTSGKKEIIEYLKNILETYHKEYTLQGYADAKLSYLAGHESFQLSFCNTDIKSVLVLMLPGGFATHQNKAYQFGVYNIRTIFTMGEKGWKDISSRKLPEGKPDEESGGKKKWCRKLMEDCKKYVIWARNSEIKDDSFYSYCQAMMQTLNTLDQYEQFRMSKDIFYLLFPAFQMFAGQLEKAMEKKDDTQWFKIGEAIKESMCAFLSAANSVIYHTIHTDQIFLMVPGYSGTSFSIPIKLSLLYLWMIDRIIQVLNDGEEEYSCILTPEMESRPVTRVISFQEQEKDRLICVKLSQRCLYFPKHLMIILSHEIGHYVGKNLRNRDKRKKCAAATMASYISEGLFPESYIGINMSDSQAMIFPDFKDEFKSWVELECCKMLLKSMKEESEEYYADVLKTELIRLSYEYLVNVDIDEWMNNYIRTMKRSYPQNLAENMKFVYSVTSMIEKRRKQLLASDVLEQIVNTVIRIYQEIFSDIIAMTILGCPEEDFCDAFHISEGAVFGENIKPPLQALREKIIGKTIFPNRQTDEQGNWGKCQEEYTPNIYNDLYDYCFLWHYLEEYAKDCYNKIQDRCRNDGIVDVVKELREMFQAFSKADNICDDQLYRTINEKIGDYRKELEKRYNFILP